MLITLLHYCYMILPNTVSNDQHIYFHVSQSLRFTSQCAISLVATQRLNMSWIQFAGLHPVSCHIYASCSSVFRRPGYTRIQIAIGLICTWDVPVRVCMCVYVHVCMYVHVYMHMYVSVCMYICVCLGIHVCVYVCNVCIYVYICVFTLVCVCV